MSSPRPPRWALWALERILPRGLPRAAILGDLEEEMERRAVSTSPAAARRWYARQALGIAVRFLARPRAASTRTGGPPVLRSLMSSLGAAARSLAHAPAFTLGAALTLAVGVGATTAIFSVVDGVLLRPLAYPRPDELLVLALARQDEEIRNFSEPEILDIGREVGSLSAVAAYRESSPVLGSADEPERVPAVLASAPLLPLLGVEPMLGRVYGPAEDVPGAAPVVVISHGLWTRVLGAAPDAVGRTLLLEGQPHTVIGVMPEGFAFPRPGIQAWGPLRLDPLNPWARNNHYLRVVARLAPGATPASAAAELDALAARATAAHPEFYTERIGIRPYLLRDDLVGDVRTPLLLLMGAVGAVLLVASMNAASLFLGRGERRRGEIALRTALGAGRVRVASQLLAESVLVAGLAGALGVALAHGGVTLLRWLAPPGLPRLDGVAVDVRVLAVGLGTALATGLVFGLVPVVHAWRSDVRDVLASAGWGGIGSRGGGRFRRGLVVVQLSLATALVLGAGLLLRSFRELRRVDLGFEPEGVLVMPLAPAVTNVAPDGDAIAFYQALERRIAGLPGVAAVGSAYRIPLADGHDNYSIRVEDRPAATLGDAPSPGMQWATPGYFGALGIPLRHGRLFTAADDADAPLVAVVNERLARELWPGEDAVGKRLRMWPEGSAWMEVVGVVADVKHYGVREDASTKLYVPHLQGYRGAYHSPNRMALFVRTEADPAALAGPVRAVVREVGPDVPIGRVRPMADIAGEALARERFTLALLGLFALVALLLAAVGVYGVVALAVVARTREIGLRMAVGADRGRVAGRVLREGLVLAAWGLVFGLAGGFLAARLLRATLFGVGPADPWTYAAAAPLLAAVVALASFLPALGAARMDPVRALRAD